MVNYYSAGRTLETFCPFLSLVFLRVALPESGDFFGKKKKTFPLITVLDFAPEIWGQKTSGFWQ